MRCRIDFKRMIFTIVALLGMMSHQIAAQGGVTISFIWSDEPSPSTYLTRFFYVTNGTASTITLQGLVLEWTDSAAALTSCLYGSGSGGSPASVDLNDVNIVPGGSASYRCTWSANPGSVSIDPIWQVAVLATATPTPTATSTPTATYTPTAGPTPTESVDRESTAEIMGQKALNAITTTLPIPAPFDWQSSNSMPDIPDFFQLGDISLMMSYLLALLEIVNTNNVVVTIFVLSLSIALMIIIFKWVANRSGSGFQLTEGYIDRQANKYVNPYLRGGRR